MKKGWKVLMIVLAVGSLLSGCAYTTVSMRREEPRYSIGVVTKADNSPYWLNLESGVREAAEELNVDITFLYPSGEEEAEEQKKIINDLLDSEPDALLIAPCNCRDTRWVAERAAEKDILLMNIDDHSADIKLPYAGSDHVQIGKDAAGYFKELLPEGGNICMLLGPAYQMSCQDRMRGFVDYLDKSFTIAGIKFTNMTQKSGYQAVMSMEAKPAGIFCQNIVVAQGAIIALQEKGWDAKIIIVDTLEDGELVMKRGNIDGVMVQDGYFIGYQAIMSAVEGLQNGGEIEDVRIASGILTPDGIKGEIQ